MSKEHGVSPLEYRMPAEWEPHAATWIAWPHNEEDWPGRFGPIPWVYVEFVRRLHRQERVSILVQDDSARRQAAGLLERAGVDGGQVSFLIAATDRVWTRDYGPTFVKSAAGRLAAVQWRFNAWAKYDNWQRDQAAGQAIAAAAGCPCWRPAVHGRPVVLEGGSIDVNGQGTLLTTEECLLADTQQRNPGLAREALESVLQEYLGVRKVLWLGRGIAGDDTHGHVDDLARFVGPQAVVAAVEPDPGDANHEPLRENLERLRSMTDADGRPFTIVTLPMPAPIHCDGQRLPASYANFYIANGLVLVPTFNDPCDRIALERLAAVFPGRQVVGIHSGDLVWGLGTLHCMTQQQPASGPL